MDELDFTEDNDILQASILASQTLQQPTVILLPTQSCFATLTEEQLKAYEFVKKRINVFITGLAGSGKSTLVKYINATLGYHRNITTTSTTGVSALLINGKTLHSAMGIGLGKGSADDIIKNMNFKAKKRIREMETLIIDEVSMLSPNLFDKLEKIARIVRGNVRPFGGIHLVLFGDFLQLPAIENNGNDVNDNNFAFESDAWEKCIKNVVLLNTIHRQSNIDFQTVLNEVRVGRISSKSKEILSSRLNIELKNDFGIKPTRIFTTNAQVDRINKFEMDELGRKTPNLQYYSYEMEFTFYGFENKEFAIEKFLKDSIAVGTLELCVGAQVMLLANIDLEMGLANGSRGVVTKFENDFPVVRFMNGLEIPIEYYQYKQYDGKKVILTADQIPLKIAYAITVHKCQGATLDLVEMDLSNCFTYGQTYVALSRVKDINNLSLLGIDFDLIKAHPKALDFYDVYK
jgi:ATP-dependent DNA helicase PIF1